MKTDELIFKILEGKEQRAYTQKELLQKYDKTLISFTLNVPGLYKISQKYKSAFNEGVRLIKSNLIENNLTLIFSEEREAMSGYEFFGVVDSSPKLIKKLMIDIEYQSLLGRLFDIDVFDNKGNLLSRSDFNMPKRKCLVCTEDAVVCSRSRAHDIEEILQAINNLIDKFNKEEKTL